MPTRTELFETEPRPLGPAVFLIRIVDLLFGVLETLLVVRLVLEFFHASNAAGFTRFIRSITEPFFVPFRGLFGASTVSGEYLIVWSLVAAIVAYAVLHAVVRALLRALLRV